MRLALPVILTLTACQPTIGQPVTVVDGDTIMLGAERIRLAGIDAPERDQWCWSSGGHAYACGVKAREALVSFTLGKVVYCSDRKPDLYGRTIATCFANNSDISQHMVSSGWAVAYHRYSDKYLPQQATARAYAAGIWQGSFTEPEKWRRRQ